MAASTAAFAKGDAATYTKADESVSKISGRKRRTLWLNQQPRPLFVSEAEFKAGKYFTRQKRTLLVALGSELLVLDVAALDAGDVPAATGGGGGAGSVNGAGGSDMSLALLRRVLYTELMSVSLCGPAALRLEHADAADRPKLASGAMLDAFGGGAGPDAPPPPAAAAGAGAGSASAGAAAGGEGGPPAGAASIRVSYDSFVLVFKEPGAAHQAAAALLYQRAQAAAAQHWLWRGLPAGFRCDPASLVALPLGLGSLPPPHGGSGGGSRGGTTGGGARHHHASGGSGGGLAAAAEPSPYPWASVSGGWGSSVPLPAGWGPVLEAAAAAASARRGDGAEEDPEVSMEDLSAAAELPSGPMALRLSFTTPLGLAVATVGPQHLRAALLNRDCRQVLAVPATFRRAREQPQPAGFRWAVSSSVPRASAAEASAGSVQAGAVPAAPAAGGAAQQEDGAGGAADAAVVVHHEVEAFAALAIEVVRTPHTAGRSGAARQFDPAAAPAAAARHLATLPSSTGEGEGSLDGGGEAGGGAAAAGAAAGAAARLQQQRAAGGLGRPQQLQLAACALLASLVFAVQLQDTPAAAPLQLLLIAAVALLALRGGGRAAAAAAAAPASAKAAPEAPDADAVAAQRAAGPSEDVTCCGWSLRLLSGDVVAAPGRYLQLQVSLARADRGLAQLRQRMATLSISSGGSAALLRAPSAAGGVPVLVSDPEPPWINPDVKQRFLNAKPTVEASREQARRTNKWRTRMDVDSVLHRPCPGFATIAATFPTYTLVDNTPEGHAVVMMKVGCIKDLCDLIFNPPQGASGVTMQQVEHTLALLNEYLVQVAAPNVLPGGFQVQLYDMDGFKLSYVGGDMITLFKMLVRFGHYYPERLHQALVLNAPGWFSYPWRLLSAFLDANTRAKVVVVGSPKTALAKLAHHMGGVDNVPAAWGGRCTTPLDQYPAQLRMMDFARRLNAGEQPLRDYLESRGSELGVDLVAAAAARGVLSNVVGRVGAAALDPALSLK